MVWLPVMLTFAFPFQWCCRKTTRHSYCEATEDTQSPPHLFPSFPFYPPRLFLSQMANSVVWLWRSKICMSSGMRREKRDWTNENPSPCIFSPPWDASAHFSVLYLPPAPPPITTPTCTQTLTAADSSTGPGNNGLMVSTKICSPMWAGCKTLGPTEFTYRPEMGPPVF